MKIGVYAPAKNEIDNVEAWYASCRDADVIVVADTGSSDGTLEKLRELGVNVTSVCITPWRFDDAFNIAQSLLPQDVDVAIRLDLDERLDTGWRETLERLWVPPCNQLRYRYIWNFNADGSPGLTWYGDRVHSRHGWRWRGATHEGLCARTADNHAVWTDEFRILHYPKGKNKSHDLDLLLEAHNESPQDARMIVYLAREYMYKGDRENAIKWYKEFLTLSGDTAERCQAMCNLSRLDSDNQVYWLKTACYESSYHREPRVDLAQYYHDRADWQQCWKWAQAALALTHRPGDYTSTPEAWGWKPHDLASLAAWNLKMYRESLEQAGLALAANPQDQRLQNNWRIVKDFYDANLSETPPQNTV